MLIHRNGGVWPQPHTKTRFRKATRENPSRTRSLDLPPNRYSQDVAITQSGLELQKYLRVLEALGSFDGDYHAGAAVETARSPLVDLHCPVKIPSASACYESSEETIYELVAESSYWFEVLKLQA